MGSRRRAARRGAAPAPAALSAPRCVPSSLGLAVSLGRKSFPPASMRLSRRPLESLGRERHCTRVEFRTLGLLPLAAQQSVALALPSRGRRTSVSRRGSRVDTSTASARAGTRGARGVRTQDRAGATPGPTAKQAPRPTRALHVDGARRSTRDRRENETRKVARRSRRLLRLRARLRYVDRRRAPFRSPLEAGAPKLMLFGAIGRRCENDVDGHGVPRPRGGRFERVSARLLGGLIWRGSLAGGRRAWFAAVRGCRAGLGGANRW